MKPSAARTRDEIITGLRTLTVYTEPMRLLFVCTSRGARGPENHTVSTALAMAARGHQVEAMASEGSFVARALRAKGVKVTPGHFRNALDWNGQRTLRKAIDAFR